VSGKWALRRYVGDQAYVVETIGIADDFDDADGVAILNFSQAQRKARHRFKQGARDEAGITGPLTVAEAIKDYLDDLEHRGKSTYDAKCRSNAFIIPKLGEIEVGKLTSRRLKEWLKGVASTPPRLRTKKGEEQKHRDLEGQRFTKSRQDRPMKEACSRAKIKPAIGFHSLLVKSGVPMRYVAEALGHSPTAMTERHYAHLAPSHVADTIRKHAPVFGLNQTSLAWDSNHEASKATPLYRLDKSYMAGDAGEYGLPLLARRDEA
jgi:hypothetical protein